MYATAARFFASHWAVFGDLEDRTRTRAAIIAFLETWIELAGEIAKAYLIGGRWTRHEVWDSKRGFR